MVILNCAVVGEAENVFPVDIDDGAKVSTLKNMIKDNNPETITCDAKDQQLFMAKKKDGTWLDGAGAASVTLDERGHPQGFAPMESTLWIKNPQYFGDNFQPGEGQIHVLVVVPEGVSASETSKMDQVAQEVHEIYEQTVLTKRKRYIHSEVTSTQGRHLLRYLKIKVDPVRTVPFPVGVGGLVGGFGWESVIDGNGEKNVLTEAQQRERYRHYVEHNIGAMLGEKRLCVVGVEDDQDVLTVKVPGHDIELSGRTDLLVLSDVIRDNPNDLQYLPDVKMLIEVKKEVLPSCDFQALSELIALDLLADDPVVALLTDLNGSWMFFWVSENKNDLVRIQKATTKNPGDAFEVIKALLAQPPPPADTDTVELPCFQRPVKRMKLRKALPSLGEGGESGGIRESIEQYYDIASMLGPDIEMARAVARQVTRSIPAFSSIS